MLKPIAEWLMTYLEQFVWPNSNEAYLSKAQLTENGCFSRVVQSNYYDFHLFLAHKPREYLSEKWAHL